MKAHLRNKGFTLIELLIAMAILGILATVGLASFRTAQMRGRDTQRKSDLKQISNAIELYYQDYNLYPQASGTNIAACPSTGPTSCAWGSGELTDGKTTYMKIVPGDPTGACPYVYIVSSSGKSYQLFAYLENTQDKNINSGISIACGSNKYNFSITSPNVTPTTNPLP